MKDDSGHFGDYSEEPVPQGVLDGQKDDLNTDLDSMKIWSPWSSEQTFHLNVFQARGNFHAFTCPNHMGMSVVKLIATLDGWVCPDLDCNYTQDWAWLAMLDARNWKTTGEMLSHPKSDGCICKLEESGPGAGWAIKEWVSGCTVHPQLQGTPLDPATWPKHGTQEVLASRPLHMGGGEVMKTVGDPDKPTWTGLFGMDPDYEVDQMFQVTFAKADLQKLNVADLFMVFNAEQLQELMPSFTAEQQMTIQSFWKDGVTREQLSGESMTPEEFDALMERGTPVDVEVDLNKEGE